MQNSLSQLIQRIFSFLGFLSLVGILLLFANFLGLFGASPDTILVAETMETDRAHIAIISGHAGFDSGAICEDDEGQLLLQEVDVVARIASIAAESLQASGHDVTVLDEYDPSLEGLQADVLISLHADSCTDASGYKVAYYEKSTIPVTNDRLLECVNQHYASATEMVLDADTITPDMTEYHAFRKIDAQTPAAILELGYLGGDGLLLLGNPEVPASGVVDSLLCFLDSAATESP